tara:strand:- start:1343 stop:2464 length:1122 start_codon:yes stop_codon:yes gene_type:complete
MGLFKGTQEQYYGFNSFKVAGSATNSFTLDYPTLPANTGAFNVYLTGTVNSVTNTSRTLITAYSVSVTSYDASTGVLVLNTQIPIGTIVEVILITPDFGNYQYIKLEDLVNNFMVGYTGEDKIINRAKRTDIVFHAKRAIQEFSYDTFKSTKSQEIEVPPSLVMELPHDYVNYVKIVYTDSAGNFRPLTPTRHTGNPTAISQDGTFEYMFNNDGTLLINPDSTTKTRRKTHDPHATQNTLEDHDAEIHNLSFGGRYGLNPELGGLNGDYYIDEAQGKINFSSNISGKIVVLKYISDGLGTDGEMIVHKFAEEAVYKCIAHAILATKMNTPEYLVARYKKERRAALRTAKLRLSNYKSEELQQIMRGKSKQIKH